MNPIKILGAGIAGLTTAINLKIAGLDVEVHEKKSYCGKHINDFQFLENWTFKENVLDFLKSIKIKTDFYYKKWYALDFYSPTLKKYTGISSDVLMYLVKRGRTDGSVDRSLEQQAKSMGIEIYYNTSLNAQEAQIIATGPQNPSWIATGVKFKSEGPDKAVLLLDNSLSLNAYSYFILNDGIGEITCCNPVNTNNLKARLQATIQKFESVLNIKVENIEERFSAAVGFNHMNKASIDGQNFIGEAAGFQDKYAGFGMLYAFKSGYFAAKSIVENLDYDRLWQNDFLKHLNISATNRMLFNRLSNEGFEKLIKILNSKNFFITKLKGGEDLKDILEKLYNHSFSQFLRPFLFRKFRRFTNEDY